MAPIFNSGLVQELHLLWCPSSPRIAMWFSITTMKVTSDVLCRFGYKFLIISSQKMWKNKWSIGATTQWPIAHPTHSHKPCYTLAMSIISITCQVSWIWTSWAVKDEQRSCWSSKHDKKSKPFLSLRIWLITQLQTNLSNWCLFGGEPCSLWVFQTFRDIGQVWSPAIDVANNKRRHIGDRQKHS